MSKLNLERNLARRDDVYAMLLARHDGKTREESEAYNARLIIVLMNHIGDAEVIREALEAADG